MTYALSNWKLLSMSLFCRRIFCKPQCQEKRRSWVSLEKHDESPVGNFLKRHWKYGLANWEIDFSSKLILTPSFCIEWQQRHSNLGVAAYNGAGSFWKVQTFFLIAGKKVFLLKLECRSNSWLDQSCSAWFRLVMIWFDAKRAWANFEFQLKYWPQQVLMLRLRWLPVNCLLYSNL